MAELPTNIGRYEVISRLGQGGMGSLYLAKDPKIGRLVAIKVVRQEFDTPEARQRFAREAQSAGTLRHPNIVTIFDVDEHEGLPFIAMEYVDAETLGELIRRKAPAALSKRLKWIEELCSGLAYAHKQGVVHRDIKPANLMLDAEGGLKILDFGLARREASKFTQSHVIIGTPNYMSPEQIRAGDVGPRSDIFAVGAVLYEVIAYTEAFPGSVHQAMHTIMYEQPVPLDELLPGLDPKLIAIVDRALQKDPDKRYQDLTAMRADLVEVRQRLETKTDDSANTMPIGGARTIRTDRASAASNFDRRPTPPSGGSKRLATNRVSLQKKRASQLEAHVATARKHFEAGELEQAREAVEQALMLDADHPLAGQLLEEIAAEEDARQILALVNSARTELQNGQLEAAERVVLQALEIAPTHPQVIQLRETIDTTRRELERARQVQETLRRARGQFAEGAFEVAIRTAGEVLAIDPDNVPARDLQSRAREAIENRDKKAERDAAAQAAVTEAREMFERGDKTAALEKLEGFKPPHDLVTAFLASLRNVGHDSSDSGQHAVIPALPDFAAAGGAASVAGGPASGVVAAPPTARFAPGRSNDAPHVASPQKTLYAGVAAAIVVLAVVIAAVYMKRGGDPATPSAESPAAETAAPSPPPAVVVPPPPVVTAPASLTAEPPSNQTERELLEGYRLLGEGQRAAAEKIVAQIKRRDPKNIEAARLLASIQQWAVQEKARTDAIAANAAAVAAASTPKPDSPTGSGSAAPTPPAAASETASAPASPPAAPAPAPANPAPIEGTKASDAAFTVLPGAGYAGNNAVPTPPLLAEVERPGIEAAIRRYEKAISDKDIRAVSQIRTFDTRQRDSWVKIFKDFKSYKLNVRFLGDPVVEPDATKATITVEERIQQTDKNGFEITQQPRTVTYKLEKIGGNWRILPP